MLTEKNVPPLVKTKKLKTGEHFGQHSGDIAVLARHDKKIATMVYIYHTGEMHVSVRRGKDTPTVVRDYNIHMEGVDLKHQMLQSYLLEWKKCFKWYLKLFKRLLNIAIHNSTVIYRSVSNTRQLTLNIQAPADQETSRKTRITCALSCVWSSVH
jgi:hypothetical protein